MDKITQERIAKLHPSVRNEVTAIINECNANLTGRSQVRIAQGLRTDQEQAALYAQGRTIPGKTVTNAKPGQSIHNYGLAVDIVLIIDGRTASWDTKADWDKDGIADWMECVAVFKHFGWDWGGNWATFKDMPHFEKKGYKWSVLSQKTKDKAGYVIL
ncbi:peptidoglycan L-alanyl-D-glutamate endopeptidase [Elizabethkingia miricola]|uniref:Peptidoglycan L-alanyl-D-glutamate endopeptidase CwlK n=1 Tax=Elizabethkingia miricola TaxID=172045 RepID=A0ABY3NFC0_ELIMR|nr:M15 family metallopeptidase [Elizabethkingia miricola]OBS12527.1 peptidoglycan L-alanyl-D-glutamate endopeptidase [Elizabethkingia miricola]TYO91143.1 peptidoglycan L-alanyl-D-glutamate endopeptidase CwlK [Elizabethkingia miricola]